MTKRFATAGTLTLLAATSAIAADAPSRADVLNTYANIAEATFEDSLIAAKSLQTAVDALIADPSDATLNAARAAWIAARVP